MIRDQHRLRLRQIHGDLCGDGVCGCASGNPSRCFCSDLLSHNHPPRPCVHPLPVRRLCGVEWSRLPKFMQHEVYEILPSTIEPSALRYYRKGQYHCIHCGICRKGQYHCIHCGICSCVMCCFLCPCAANIEGFVTSSYVSFHLPDC